MEGRGPLVVPPGGWRAAFTSLRNRDFRVFWLSTVFSFTGMQMGQVVRSWLVYEITDSPTYLGLIGAVSAIPMIIFSLPGGVVADRVVKRNLLVATQAAMFLIAVSIAILITGVWIQVWHVIAASFLAGIAMSFNMPGRQAMISDLVKPEQLMNAIAMNSAGSNLTRIIAPTAAGLLVGAIGLGGTYYVYAACYVFVVITLFMVPPTVSYRARATVREDTMEGLNYIRNNPILIALLVLGLVPAIFAMPYQMLMPVFARDVFNVGAQGLGLLMGVTGIGALVGSIIVAMLGNFERKGLLSLLAGLAFGGTLILFGMSSNFYLSMAILVLLGTASTCFMAVNNTLVLSYVPEELRGRVMGVYMMSFGLMPLGSLPAGALADIIGAPLTVMIAGSITVLFSVGALVFVPSVRKLK